MSSETITRNDLKAVLDEVLPTIGISSTYTGSNGLKISRVGRVATIETFPTATTTSSSSVIGNITDSKFYPITEIQIATRVYNGSTYVDCTLLITTSGSIQLRSPTNATTAGYQGQWCKLKGFTYICAGV